MHYNINNAKRLIPAAYKELGLDPRAVKSQYLAAGGGHISDDKIVEILGNDYIADAPTEDYNGSLEAAKEIVKYMTNISNKCS